MQPYPQPFTTRDSWPPGTVVKDDYVIESRLGKGGFGTVYKAKHRFLQSDHVIKRLHEEYSSDEEYVRKFIAEGQVIRRLRECPYVVTVEHMTLTADQYLILIMEFMPGGDLNNLIQERRFFTVAEATGYAVQIAEGLRAAHAIDLIHRDVKPANVLLAENKRKAKLTDFGIAADHHSSQATSVVRGGSLGYAAPEQWTTSGRNLDGRTDIYALGVTMYQMLAQLMPYSASDIGAWIDAVRTTQPIHVNKLREDVPEDLNQLIMQMIEVRREHRPPNIESVLERLKPYANAEDWNRSAVLRAPAPDRTMPMPTHDTGSPLPPYPPPPVSTPRPPSYTPTQYQPPSTPGQQPYSQPQPPSFSAPPQQHFEPPPSYGGPASQQPLTQQPQHPSFHAPPQQFTQQPPPPPSYGGPPQQPPTQQPQHPSFNEPQQQYTPQPPPPTYPPQQQWTPQHPVQRKKSGGAGKWFAIVPLVLALTGAGGWFGWKYLHPDPIKNDKGDQGDTDPKIDWLKRGDDARDRKDYHEALRCFRKQPSGVARIQGVQTLVETHVEEKVATFSNGGFFEKADALVDEWLAEFPDSERLKAQKALITRRRAAQ